VLKLNKTRRSLGIIWAHTAGVPMKDSVTLPILDSGAIIIADGVILDGGMADPLDSSNSKEDGDSSLNNKEDGDRVAAIIADGDSLSNKARLNGASLLKVDKEADGVARAGDLHSCIN
jgi:hypothetical protein